MTFTLIHADHVPRLASNTAIQYRCMADAMRVLFSERVGAANQHRQLGKAWDALMLVLDVDPLNDLLPGVRSLTDQIATLAAMVDWRGYDNANLAAPRMLKDDEVAFEIQRLVYLYGEARREADLNHEALLRTKRIEDRIENPAKWELDQRPANIPPPPEKPPEIVHLGASPRRPTD